MAFKIDTYIAANDPGLAHAVARSFVAADLHERDARFRRVRAAGHKRGSLAAWRTFFGDDLVAEAVVRPHGERASWTVAGYGRTRVGEAGAPGHGLCVHGFDHGKWFDCVPISVMPHAVARMLARTIHSADRHAVKAALVPFFLAWWAQPASAPGSTAIPKYAEVALCCPSGVLLGVEWTLADDTRWGALLKTWLDAEGAADSTLRRVCAALPLGLVQGLYRTCAAEAWQPFTTVDTTKPAASAWSHAPISGT